MKRKISQWQKCKPSAMVITMSPAALQFALEDARADILALYAVVERVARLNPYVGEEWRTKAVIGPGMLCQLVDEARRVVVQK